MPEDVLVVAETRIVLSQPRSELIEVGLDTLVVERTRRELVEVGADTLVIETPGTAGPAGVPGPQGPPGPQGGTGEALAVLAGENLARGQVIALSPDDLAYAPDAANPQDGERVLGVAGLSALAGEMVAVVTDGLLETSPVWSLGPLFLGENGSLVSAPPSAGFQLQVAVALTSSLLLVRPQFPIYL